MAIRLYWANAYNGNVSGFNVYRSLSKDTIYDPDNLIGSYPTTTLDFEDTTALPDVVYFYGVESLTALGTMQSKPIIAIQYMNTAGPGGVKPLRGSVGSGLLDMTTASNMTDFWGLCNGVQQGAMAPYGVSVRGAMGPIPGYREDHVMKLSIDGKVQFIAADYRNFLIHSTAAGRQAWDEGLLSAFTAGVYFEYQGYRLKMDLMDLDVAMNYWSRVGGGPTNENGWVPRMVIKPIPAHANHYALVRKGDKAYRIRGVDGYPYPFTATEALLTEPFTAGGFAYPLWSVTPAD